MAALVTPDSVSSELQLTSRVEAEHWGQARAAFSLCSGCLQNTLRAVGHPRWNLQENLWVKLGFDLTYFRTPPPNLRNS